MDDKTDVRAAKQRLRTTVAAARRALTAVQLDEARQAVAGIVLARCDADADAGATWHTVLAYQPLPTEPASSRLLDGLRERGRAVYVPVLRPDRDLEWTSLDGGTARSVDFAASADAVLVPAFAVDHRGMRLGRGGGSYDRVLPRVSPDAVLVALLHAGEVVENVPAENWDCPVRSVVSPGGWLDLPTVGARLGHNWQSDALSARDHRR